MGLRRHFGVTLGQSYLPWVTQNESFLVERRRIQI